MATHELTVSEFKDILRGAAGEGDGDFPDVQFMDTAFSDLGYESVALLEVGGHVERKYGIRLEDSVLAEAETPRQFIEAVNKQFDDTTIKGA